MTTTVETAAMLRAWAALTAAWLALHLVLLHRIASRAARGRRRSAVLAALAEFCCLPELARAARGGRLGARPPHRLDALLAGGPAGGAPGQGMAVTIGSLALVTTGAILVLGTALGAVGSPGWIAYLIAASPACIAAAASLRRLGILWRGSIGAMVRRRRLAEECRVVRERCDGAGRPPVPPTAGEWQAAAEMLERLEADPERLLLARLRCLDRAATADGDRSAPVAHAQARLCLAHLGLEARTDDAILQALLADYGTVAAAECQVRLLVHRLASPAPARWRELALVRTYGLLARLQPRLDPIAASRLWRAATAAGQDAEAWLRASEWLAEQEADCPAPEPLLGPLFAHRAAHPWRADSLGIPPGFRPEMPRLDPAPAAVRAIGRDQAAIARFEHEVANGLDADGLADVIGRLRDPSRFPRLHPAAAARLAWLWANDARRADASELAAVVPRLAAFGEFSLLSASSLSGLADGLARYSGPLARAALDAIDAASNALDARLALTPSLAAARALARLDAAAGEQALWRYIARLLPLRRTRRLRDDLAAAITALGLVRTARAVTRLRHTGEAILRGTADGPTAPVRARSAVPVELCAVAAALAARGSVDGAVLLSKSRDAIGPADPACPASMESFARLAAAGDAVAIQQMLECVARPGQAGGVVFAPRVARQVLRRCAEGSILIQARAMAAADARHRP